MGEALADTTTEALLEEPRIASVDVDSAGIVDEPADAESNAESVVEEVEAEYKAPDDAGELVDGREGEEIAEESDEMVDATEAESIEEATAMELDVESAIGAVEARLDELVFITSDDTPEVVVSTTVVAMEDDGVGSINEEDGVGIAQFRSKKVYGLPLSGLKLLATAVLYKWHSLLPTAKLKHLRLDEQRPWQPA